MQTATGSVKWFDPKRNHGFLKVDVGELKEIYFHASGVQAQQGAVVNLKKDDRVEFVIAQNRRGAIAKKVRIIAQKV